MRESVHIFEEIIEKFQKLSKSNDGIMSSSTEIVQQGWLTKSPPAKGLFRPRWRRRWFILRNGTFPNQFVLEYFTDETCRRQKGQINLDECEQIAAPLSVQDRHKFTFNLRTPSRVYYLAADTENEMNKWVSCLCQVCGLKTVEDETEVYTKPVDENNQPASTYRPDSDESSPSLSVHMSGPYIPISQCHTGKPIVFNDNNESPYYNTSFPFPPKVNWATHPTKKEDNEQGVSPSELPPSLNAPPRPPKKSASGVSNTLSSLSPSEATKSIPQPTSTRSVFPYDNLDETHDSSSTCSSLHSPPSSAGVLYSNIPEISPVHYNANNNGTNLHGSSSSYAPGDFVSSGGGGSLPPKVDRNLKPDLRKPLESPSFLASQQSPNGKCHNGKHLSKAMTLPTKNSPRFPNGTNFALDPTPAMKKTLTTNGPTRYSSQEGNTSTLPSRRGGPVPGPGGGDKKRFHDYDPGSEVTYTHIDYSPIEHESKSASIKPFSHKRSQSASHSEEAGTVEYRHIDHVKTKALNKMLQDREVQLRNNVNKNLK